MGNGCRRVIVCAVECNPDTVPFADWWDRATTEFGGGEFVEYLDRSDPVFDRVIDEGFDLQIEAGASYLYIGVVATCS